MAMPSVSFDRAAAYYDDTRHRSPAAAAAETALLTGVLAGRGRVLEIGVGTGQVSIPLHGAGIPMVGVDLSRAMLQVLLGKVGGVPAFPLVQGDATRLPLADDAVGAALVRWVLHLIPDWRTTVAELVRVVRPGGVVLADVGGPGDDIKGTIQRRFAAFAGVDRRPAGLDWNDLDGLDGAFGVHGAEVGLLETFDDADEEPVAAYLASLEANRYSWTWPLSDETRQRAVAQTRAWAEATYGPLEDLRADTYEVSWRAYRLA